MHPRLQQELEPLLLSGPLAKRWANVRREAALSADWQEAKRRALVLLASRHPNLNKDAESLSNFAMQLPCSPCA